LKARELEPIVVKGQLLIGVLAVAAFLLVSLLVDAWFLVVVVVVLLLLLVVVVVGDER